jgi:hypothetical protein
MPSGTGTTLFWDRSIWPGVIVKNLAAAAIEMVTTRATPIKIHFFKEDGLLRHIRRAAESPSCEVTVRRQWPPLRRPIGRPRPPRVLLPAIIATRQAFDSYK